MSIPSEAKQQVARLLAEGKQNEAITYLEETFQISLIDAKALVELVERELNKPADLQPSDINVQPVSTEIQPSSGTDAGTSTLWGPIREEVKMLIIAGRKIEAVKLVNDQFRKGLKESLAMVDEVQQEIDPSQIPASSKRGCTGNVFKIMAVLFGIVAFILFAIAAIGNWGIQDQIDRSDRVKGRVVMLKQTTEGTYTPVISYEQNGDTREFTSTYSSNPPEYAMNEEVYLLVDRENPDNILIDGFTDRWLGIIIIAGIGAFFTFFTALLAFAARRF